MGQIKLDCLHPSTLSVCGSHTWPNTMPQASARSCTTYSPLQACVKASSSGAPNAPCGSRRRPDLTWRVKPVSSSGYLFVQLYTRQVRVGFYLAACGVEEKNKMASCKSSCDLQDHRCRDLHSNRTTQGRRFRTKSYHEITFCLAPACWLRRLPQS